MKKVFVVLACLVAAGCATAAKYEAALQSWVGSDESTLISAWGTPAHSYQMTNGQRSLGYTRNENILMGGGTYTTPETVVHQGTIDGKAYTGTSTVYVPRQEPVYDMKMRCDTTFIIDTDGIVRSWQWDGNGCASAPVKSAD